MLRLFSDTAAIPRASVSGRSTTATGQASAAPRRRPAWRRHRRAGGAARTLAEAAARRRRPPARANPRASLTTGFAREEPLVHPAAQVATLHLAPGRRPIRRRFGVPRTPVASGGRAPSTAAALSGASRTLSTSSAATPCTVSRSPLAVPPSQRLPGGQSALGRAGSGWGAGAGAAAARWRPCDGAASEPGRCSRRSARGRQAAQGAEPAEAQPRVAASPLAVGAAASGRFIFGRDGLAHCCAASRGARGAKCPCDNPGSRRRPPAPPPADDDRPTNLDDMTRARG